MTQNVEKLVSLQEYQKWTEETAIYPEAKTGSINELMYCALGLAGEAGEMANTIKKLYRDGEKPELRAHAASELGDVMWYAARLAESLGVDLNTLIHQNREKLLGRKERGTLQGSGEVR